MRHIIPISGKDSLATAIIMKELHPRGDYEYFFNPTGAELPEIFTWLDKVEEMMGIKIHRIGKSLEEIISEYNYFLPGPRQRYCTRRAKIEPMIKWIGSDPATIYFGIRADENRLGFDNSKYPNVTPSYPLVDQNIKLMDVYRIIIAKELKPPTFFWQRLYDDVQEHFEVDLKESLGLVLFDILFAGRSRANCYFCFFQAPYELVWLLDAHPELFEISESYEHKGHKAAEEKTIPFFGDEFTYEKPEKRFTWKSDYGLDYVRKNWEKLYRDRVATVRGQISKIIGEGKMNFNDIMKPTELEMTSCGLFCGK